LSFELSVDGLPPPAAPITHGALSTISASIATANAYYSRMRSLLRAAIAGEDTAGGRRSGCGLGLEI
jgi:hypothetical protein